MNDVASAMGYVSAPRLTRWSRFKLWMFPPNYCELPIAPSHFKDVVRTRVDGHLDFKDRLRVLLTGHVIVETRVVTEHEAGDTMSQSTIYVGTGGDK